MMDLSKAESKCKFLESYLEEDDVLEYLKAKNLFFDVARFYGCQNATDRTMFMYALSINYLEHLYNNNPFHHGKNWDYLNDLRRLLEDG